MLKKTIKDLNLAGKRVLVRVDYNVPLDENGNITDNNRIAASLPTIKYLLEKKAKIILLSHLGRPKGQSQEKYSLKPVVKTLSGLLGREVKMAADCIGPEVKKLVNGLVAGDVLLLENLRFHSEEEKNDPQFSKTLAELGEVFVQDAFGTVHRAHASTEGITKYFSPETMGAGLLLEKEINYLSQALEKAARPFLAILGGAKVSDKIGVIENLISKVDILIIGGAMAYTFLKAHGVTVGKSLVEEDKVELARQLWKKAEAARVKIVLPLDHLIVEKIDPQAQSKETEDADIPDGWIGVDIGPLTIDRCRPFILTAKTIIWNGPLGIFEMEKFAQGTLQVAKLLAEATGKGALSIIGGGDSVAAVKKAGVAEQISHISTGGGASLEFLEGKSLPGLAALPDK
ncbi:MAG: phosphoglycerate kinase [Elusimicrobiota bacterium]